MFGSTLLEVLIGLLLLFLVLSMTASAIVEMISSLTHQRARKLQLFMRQLLAPSESNRLASEAMVRNFYENTLIGPGVTPGTMPSYIQSDQFVSALFSFLGFSFSRTASVEELRSIANNLSPNAPLRKLLLTAIDRSEGDMSRLAVYIEDWFNGQMKNVSGWYKRWAQRTLVGIGLFIALAFNVDTIALTDALLTNPTLREAVVVQAQAATAAGAEPTALELAQQVSGLGLPIGWPVTPDADQGVWWYVMKLAGLAITGFAVSQGAPFWFDLLNRVTNLRASVRPPEPTPPAADTVTQVPWRTG
mgnify:FL=1